MDNFLGRRIHQPFLETWYHLNKEVENPMLATFPGKQITDMRTRSVNKQNVLMRERILRLVGKVPHLQETIVEESTHSAQGMDGTAEMSAVVHKWIGTAATDISVRLSTAASATHCFFLAPSCKAPTCRFCPAVGGEFSSEDISGTM